MQSLIAFFYGWLTFPFAKKFTIQVKNCVICRLIFPNYSQREGNRHLLPTEFEVRTVSYRACGKKPRFVSYCTHRETELVRCSFYLRTRVQIQRDFKSNKLFNLARVIVIPPNSNTFPSWRKTYQKSLTSAETITWTFDSHLILIKFERALRK